jgi:hypothetical protein
MSPFFVPTTKPEYRPIKFSTEINRFLAVQKQNTYQTGNILIFIYISASYAHDTGRPREYVERRCWVMRNTVPPVGSFLRTDLT